MKIIQITTVNSNTGFPNIFGLAEDNKVYSYQWKTGSWKQFKSGK